MSVVFVYEILIHVIVIISNSHIGLPPLPQGLQIMADQGFQHRLPVLVLPKTNQQQLPN